MKQRTLHCISVTLAVVATLFSPADTIAKAREKVSIKWVNAFYVNASKEWPVRLKFVGEKPTAIVMKVGNLRPIHEVELDAGGNGSALDHNNFEWQFRGYTTAPNFAYHKLPGE